MDLNCDLGEGSPHDEELMPFITSANIACGFHAGSPSLALAALRAAKLHGIQVGAHPGYPDPESFGRRELVRDPERVFEDCVYQIGALAGLARTVDLSLTYVKPHGALYNQACREEPLAQAIVEACAVFALPVMALPGSALQRLSKAIGFVAEGFADRRYQPDGTLVPRTQRDAFVADPVEAVKQAQWLLQEHGVQTLCVHGDNPQAMAFVRQIRASLEEVGMPIRPFPRKGV